MRKDEAISEVIQRQPPAGNFVKIEPELSGCGRYGGASWDILMNTHKTRNIVVLVVTKWKYNHRDHQQKDYYTLGPQSKYNLGCDFWRGDFELQEFDRRILDAFYS